MALVNGPKQWFSDATTVEPPGEPPYDGGMEARVAALEAVIPTLATREDVVRLEAKVHQELHALTWRLIGVCAALVGVVYFIAKNIH